jgi:hypothetical protein
MKLDEYEFFRDATLQICSSLDIEKASLNYLQHMRSIVPASHVALAQFEASSRNLMTMFILDHLGEKKSLPPIPMSRESVNDIMLVAVGGDFAYLRLVVPPGNPFPFGGK